MDPLFLTIRILQGLRAEFPSHISSGTIIISKTYFLVSVFETLYQPWTKLESIKIFSDVIQSQKKFLFEEQKKSWKKNKQTMLKKNRNFVSIILYFNKKNYILLKSCWKNIIQRMFTSTDIRQKGVTDFLTAYQQNCALNGSIPIKPILNGIGGTALFIDISKVFSGGWTYGKFHYRWLKT